MVWDPDLYARFAEERAKPFHDLMSMVQVSPDMTVLDLGCGTGRMTRVLHDTLGAKHTLGVDTSGQMLSRSTEYVTKDLSFEQADMGQIQIRPRRDLVFSNAAIHWLPDHEELIAHLSTSVADGGQIAIQVPANHQQPAHVLANVVAKEAPFAALLHGWVKKHHVLRPLSYDRILRDQGFEARRVELRIYGHELPNLDAAVEWLRGTLLRAYADRLDAPMFERFVQDYRRKMHQEIGDAQPFYWPYRRILMWGRRS